MMELVSHLPSTSYLVTKPTVDCAVVLITATMTWSSRCCWLFFYSPENTQQTNRNRGTFNPTDCCCVYALSAETYDWSEYKSRASNGMDQSIWVEYYANKRFLFCYNFRTIKILRKCVWAQWFRISRLIQRRDQLSSMSGRAIRKWIFSE